jgi:hypothetical protein
MLRTVKNQPKLDLMRCANEIVNEDGSLFEKGKPSRQPINGLNTIDGDLDVNGATRQAQLRERSELDAKFAELEELIRQTRSALGTKNTPIKRVK